MLGLNKLKQSRVYQETLEEGKKEGKQKAKLEAIPRMVQFGLSVEAMGYAPPFLRNAPRTAIAQLLDLPLDIVQ